MIFDILKNLLIRIYTSLDKNSCSSFKTNRQNRILFCSYSEVFSNSRSTLSRSSKALHSRIEIDNEM